MKTKTKLKAANGAKPVRDRARAYQPGPVPSGPGPLIGTVNHRGIYTQLGYHSVRVAARDGRTSIGGSGDMHMRFNKEQLDNQAREFSRDNGLFQGIIDRAGGYIVGTGFVFQARTKDKGWNAAAEAWRKRFCETVEISGLLSWGQVEELLIRELLSMGDTAILKTDDEKIQIIESEQIRGRTVQNIDGLRRDSRGRVTGYWIAPYTQHGAVDYPNAREISAEHVLFGMKADRPSAKRGVPPLQAAFSMFHRINDIANSEAIARQIQARFAVSINKAGAAADALNQSTADTSKTGQVGNLADRISEMDYGIAVFAEPGETVQGIERSAPGREFTDTMTMFLRLLGVPLGIPLEVILLDWTKSNYSQSRAVLEQAYQSFIRWQNILEQRFHRQLWRWMVDIATSDPSDNGLPPREDQYEHEWIKPTFPWIDQLQEAQAYGAQLDRSLCTLSDVLKSKNKDLDEVLAARDREIRKAIEYTDKIKQDTGKDVAWEHMAGLPYSVNKPAAQGESKPEKAEAASKTKPAKEGEEEAAVVAPEPPKPLKTIAEVASRDEEGRAKTFILKRVYAEETGKPIETVVVDRSKLREGA